MLDPEITLRIDEFIRARGPDYQRLVAERRKRANERKRKTRQQLTPDQCAHARAQDRARKASVRAGWSPEQREHERARERNRDRRKIRPFMAIDGEGGGVDDLSRQNYLLMVGCCPATGEEHFLRHEDGTALSTIDCLEFLLSLPSGPILVAYGIGYDATQILRGLKPPTLKQILNPRQGKNGPCYTYWGDYAIRYQQGQYLSVARVDRSGPKPKVLKGSCRTVYETLGFFQCAFVEAIKHWKTGTYRERRIISKNKAHRNEFSKLTPGITEYCKLECQHLAMLMSELREVCAASGILPERWSGAGWLASALLKKHGIPKRPLTARERAALSEKIPTKNPRPTAPRRPERDREFEAAANSAYYGGRFEVSRIGLISGPVYQYDLRSAYPAAMPELPCPLHTRWQHKPRTKQLPATGLYLAKVTFSHPNGRWCGFPFRRHGGLYWPFQGTGWYWSHEIEAAIQHLHAKVIVRDLWVARCECSCRPFDWVRDLYQQRRRLGSKTKGYPLKLGLNSLYGKMAQGVGSAPYHDPVSAGLITAITRARLIRAIGQDPGAVVMVATDAVFSTRPLALDIGEGLGQWELDTWPDLFIAQPGVYWSPTKLQDSLKSLKSRGAPRSVIGPAAPLFQEAFDGLLDVIRQPGAMPLLLKDRLIPAVPVTLRVFYGHGLALARHKPWLAGKWDDVTRYISFEWNSKRAPRRVDLGEGHISTYPISLSSPFLESEGHRPPDFDRRFKIVGETGGAEAVDENTLLEAMPDHVRFLPHDE